MKEPLQSTEDVLIGLVIEAIPPAYQVTRNSNTSYVIWKDRVMVAGLELLLPDNRPSYDRAHNWPDQQAFVWVAIGVPLHNAKWAGDGYGVNRTTYVPGKKSGEALRAWLEYKVEQFADMVLEAELVELVEAKR